MRNAPKVLVFANRIKTVRFVQQTITDAGFKAAQLHGDRSQAEREACFFSASFGICNVVKFEHAAPRLYPVCY